MAKEGTSFFRNLGYHQDLLLYRRLHNVCCLLFFLLFYPYFCTSVFCVFFESSNIRSFLKRWPAQGSRHTHAASPSQPPPFPVSASAVTWPLARPAGVALIPWMHHCYSSTTRAAWNKHLPAFFIKWIQHIKHQSRFLSLGLPWRRDRDGTWQGGMVSLNFKAQRRTKIKANTQRTKFKPDPPPLGGPPACP